MPAWLLPILLKYGVPLAIQLLRTTGALNLMEAEMVRIWVAAKHIKTFPEEGYPTGKNGERDEKIVSIGPSNANFNQPKR